VSLLDSRVGSSSLGTIRADYRCPPNHRPADCRCFFHTWDLGCLVLFLLNPAAGMGTGSDWRVFETPSSRARPDMRRRRRMRRSDMARRDHPSPRRRVRGLPFILGFWVWERGPTAPLPGFPRDKSWVEKSGVPTLSTRHPHDHTGSVYTGKYLVLRSPADQKPATTSPPGMDGGVLPLHVG
jgi:hypothetical protein